MDIPTPNSIMRGENGPRTSWVVAAVTGAKLHKGGKHGSLRTLDLALGWRIWTAVGMWWLGVFTLGTTAFVLVGASSHTLSVVWPIVAINAVVIYLAMGLTFVRLCAQSDFNIRGPFKPCWRLALHVPNVAPIWFYMSPFLTLLWGMSGITVLMLLAA